MPAEYPSGVAAYSTTPDAENSVLIFTPEGTLRPLAEIELEIYTRGLARCPNKGKLARQLGVGRSTLYRRLHELGWENPNESRSPAESPPAERRG